MNARLKQSSVHAITLTLVGVALGLPLRAAEASDVLPPAKRAEILARAVKSQQPRESVSSPATNPFFPAAFDAAVADNGRASEGSASPGPVADQAPAGPRTGKDLLQAIATSLKPSGYFVLGGQPTLVFGQKRVKAGGVLTVTYEGTEYALEITAIDRTHFTLRLNREDFTRPIK